MHNLQASKGKYSQQNAIFTVTGAPFITCKNVYCGKKCYCVAISLV